MKTVFGTIAAAMVAALVSAPAHADLMTDVAALQNATVIQAQTRAGLNWHVGDKADYKLDIGGFIQGTSHNFVREATDTGFWMEQDMAIAGQNQKVEVLLNKSTGQIEKLLVNGQEQSIPKSDQKVLEMHKDHITVAAGSFDCIYAKIQNQSDQKITEAWINPKVVPMSGILKALSDSEYGKVTEEATSMEFGH